jgi:U4/U6 small nuclear ribonucleoprotein PRP31
MVGANTAAKLMLTAGGLNRLCKMPACNILVLGTQKKMLNGFSSAAILPHTGFIYNSEFVQLQPPYIRRQVAKSLAGEVNKKFLI